MGEVAGELTGLSSTAPGRLLAASAAALAGFGGPPVRFTATGGVDAARRVRGGERLDLVVLADEPLRALAQEGAVRERSLRPLYLSSVVLAVPDAAPRPALETEDDLVAVLRGARRIARSTGPSGAALLALLERLGLQGELADHLVQVPPGVPVARALAAGEADVGLQQLSELSGAPGVRVLGPLPGGAAITSTFSGAVAATSTRPQEAADCLDLLAGAALAPLAVEHGLRLAPP